MSSKFDTTLVKRPHQSEKYSNDQIQEIARCIQDPVHFIEEYCQVISLDEGLVPFKEGVLEEVDKGGEKGVL